MFSKVRIGVVKVGNIGTSTMIDLLLDERAEREDIDFRIVGSGPKMQEEDCKECAQKILEFNPHLVLIVSPNPALPGPTAARRIVAGAGKPVIVIGDAPGKKAVPDLEKEGMGYLLIEADAMIGARREFLDPAEMALFNANVIKVLAATGAFNVICEEVEKAIEGIKKGSPYLPRVVITRQKAVETAGFQNPYALAKAMAAYEMAKKVADLSVEGCFKMKEMKEYVPTVASSHEMMETAARLAGEARELEKATDSLLRRPHADDGKLLSKRKLMEKPG
ncbi:MAG: F420-dependent methylenetetrahydromethanopterin dehydrogenase [Hadesarchaea archaeon]|nr:MAG: F420-dependent methylenetetrahydromethanopterin dehydrogenase [Hadesarchaea archaeon]